MNYHLIELLQSPVDVKRLVRKLKFSVDALEKAAEEQPSLRLEAGKFRAQIALDMQSAKRKLLRVIGKKSLSLRKSGDYKTEGAVKNKLSLDSKVQRLQKEYDTLEVYNTFTKDIMEAYTERSMAVNVLTKLRSSEVSSHLASIKGDSVVEELSKKAKHIRDTYDELEGE
jgi:hypothetical protein